MKKQLQSLRWGAYVTVAAAGGYLAVRYLLPVLFPFIIGLGIAALVQRPANALSRRTRLPHKPAAVLVFFFTAGGISLILWGIGSWTAAVLREVFADFPAYLSEAWNTLNARFPESEWLRTNLPDMLSAAVTQLVAWLTEGVSGIPSLGMGVILSLLSAVYFSTGWPAISGFLSGLLTPEQRARLHRGKEHALHTAGRMAAGILFLMGVTFAELALGFWLMKIPHFLTLSALVALVDALPVLGTGTILLPWAAILLLQQNYTSACWILVLWGVVTAVRTVLEPRLLGKQAGLPPVVMFISLYAGGRLFGLSGMILLPAIAIAVRRWLKNKMAKKIPRSP